MKYPFNFLQVANWLIVCREKLKEITNQVENNKLSKDDAIKLLLNQKKMLSIVKEAIERKTRLQGTSPDFLKTLANTKKELGIEE
jgi:hypothetical protein